MKKKSKNLSRYPWTSGESASISRLESYISHAVKYLNLVHCFILDMIYSEFLIMHLSPTNQNIIQYTLNWDQNPSKYCWGLLASSLCEVNQKTVMEISTISHLKGNRWSGKTITLCFRTITNINQATHRLTTSPAVRLSGLMTLVGLDKSRESKSCVSREPQHWLTGGSSSPSTKLHHMHDQEAGSGGVAVLAVLLPAVQSIQIGG